jgi:hypothetical protein
MFDDKDSEFLDSWDGGDFHIFSDLAVNAIFTVGLSLILLLIWIGAVLAVIELW